MNLRRFLFTLFALALAVPGFGQSKAGPFTIKASSSPCAQISVTGQATVAIQVTGTFSATLQPEISIQGQAAQNTQVTPSTSTTAQSTVTAAGIYSAAVAGGDTFLVCVASYASGTATIYLNASQAVAANVIGGAAASAANFGTLGGGTNTSATMQVGSGASLGPTATGIIVATSVVGPLTFALPAEASLLGEYRLTDGAGTTIADSSGNGNTGTFTCVNSGTNPTWIAGGLHFVGGSKQCVTLPAALNSGLTFIFAYSMQPGSNFSGTNFSSLLQESVVGGSAVTALNFISANGAPSSVNRDENAINMTVWSTGSTPSQVQMGGQGIHVAAFVGAATDHIYLDGNEPTLYATGPSAHTYNPGANSGVWVLGGNSFNTSWFSGNIYYFAVWNTALSAAQVATATQVISNALAQRGVVSPTVGQTNVADNFLVDGDSIAAGYANLTFNLNTWPTNVALTNASSVWDPATPGAQAITQITPNIANPLNYYGANGQRNAVLNLSGRNDFVISGASQAAVVGAIYSYAHQVRTQGFKFFSGSLVSGNQYSPQSVRSNYNAYLAQHWPEFADGFVDFAGDPNLGCQTCNASTTYFLADEIHPNLYGNTFMQWMTQREWNWFYGKKDWTSANVYTTSSQPSCTPTALSAATISTSNSATATVTCANSFVVGNRVSMTGNTPSGYNTDCIVATASGTGFTCVIGTTGLGNGSGFGTAVAAQQIEVDNFIRLAGSAVTPAFVLLSACGFTGQVVTIKNENTTSPWVLNGWTSSGVSQELIDGQATLTMPVATASNFPVVKLMATNLTPTTPVCGWERLQ